jgi:hypothetical protein
MWFSVNGKASDAELEAWRNLGQCCLGAHPSRQAVCDDADIVSALGLTVGKIQDVTNNAADWCAHGVQDPKWFV